LVGVKSMRVAVLHSDTVGKPWVIFE
jgi:hypothetical protein